MENLSNLLGDAANLMLVGMVVVFAFLGLLIICIELMSKFFGGEIETKPVQSAIRPNSTNDTARSAKITAAISAAIHQHRQK
ncbi:OadG family protein [Algibacillus agarilyticus]|uniref:OadG family protein n=1 Tax=Algibacillus agarilyticus TaxID=2234133 RepID=UPI000DD0A56E|nr:OadG family transporter subunit [Algibacillus agarilyticus]